MTVIWKFTLDAADEQMIKLPRGADLLTVQMQFGLAQLWARVDPSAPIERRLIRIVGTGHTIDFDGRYIGTFQIDGGALVFHAFDCGRSQG